MSSEAKEQKIRDRGWEIEMKKYDFSKSMLSSFYKSWFIINIGAIGLVLTYLTSLLPHDDVPPSQSLVIWLVVGIGMFLLAVLSTVYMMYFEATAGETSTLMQYIHLNDLERHDAKTPKTTKTQNKFSELTSNAECYVRITKMTLIVGFSVGVGCITMGLIDSLIKAASYLPYIIISISVLIGSLLVMALGKIEKWADINSIYNEINQKKETDQGLT